MNEWTLKFVSQKNEQTTKHYGKHLNPGAGWDRDKKTGRQRTLIEYNFNTVISYIIRFLLPNKLFK